LADLADQPCLACLPRPALLHLRTIIYSAAGMLFHEQDLEALSTRQEEVNAVARLLIMCGVQLLPNRPLRQPSPSLAPASMPPPPLPPLCRSLSISSTSSTSSNSSNSSSCQPASLASPPPPPPMPLLAQPSVATLMRAPSTLRVHQVMDSLAGAHQQPLFTRADGQDWDAHSSLPSSADPFGVVAAPLTPYAELRALNRAVQEQLHAESAAFVQEVSQSSLPQLSGEVAALIASFLYAVPPLPPRQ
jgi:hypothetical protein